jgi:hypothetical protein
MSWKGTTWNESELFDDPITLRKVRRMTKRGHHNNTATYHTGASWSENGEDLIFTSARNGRSFLAKCSVSTGDITCLIEPVDGFGGRGELHRNDLVRGMVGNGTGVSWNALLAPRTRWAVYGAGRSIRAVHIDTLEERTLIADCGAEWLVEANTISPDETELLLHRSPVHPQLATGEMRTKEYAECFPGGRVPSEILRMPLSGGDAEVVWSEDEAVAGHVQYCPADGDLILLDRNHSGIPRNQWPTRCYALRLSTGELTPLPPENPLKFQMHATWTWDGGYVIYHGPAEGGGWFIGLIEPDGTVFREYLFPGAAYYGHVSAASERPAIILDGNIMDGILMWLYFDAAKPRIEIIARHGTDIATMPGQYGHAHPQSDPTGRFISFNSAPRAWAARGKSDVYVVEV